MFAFVPTGLAPWEVVAFSALCALSVLCIATAVGATVGYFATRAPRAVRQSAPARVVQTQPQPTGVISATPSTAGVG
jgi:hypothetical protein